MRTLREITDHFRGMFGIYLKLLKSGLGNTRISLDLCPKPSPDTGEDSTVMGAVLIITPKALWANS